MFNNLVLNCFFNRNLFDDIFRFFCLLNNFWNRWDLFFCRLFNDFFRLFFNNLFDDFFRLSLGRFRGRSARWT